MKSDTALLDAALLTTADKLTYPYIGDLNARARAISVSASTDCQKPA